MKKIGLLLPLLAVLLSGSILAAPITAGDASVDAEALEGSSVIGTEENGVFDVTAPTGKLPIALSADGKTVIVASNDPVKETLPVTTYASNSYKDYITYRKPLTNTYKKLTEDKELTVVYFGGSVTMGYKSSVGGWRCLSGDWFKKQFPEADITLINAGLGESGTFMGTYRVQNDVIAKNPDLVFVEYAINDKYKGVNQARAALQYETVIREIKQALPDCDIVTLLVTDRGVAVQLPDLYPTAAGHAEIAAKYNIPVVNVGGALVNHMGGYSNDEVWNTYFWDGVHPKDEGYQVYFACLKEYLTNMLMNTDYSNIEPVRDVLIPVQSEYLLDGERVSVFGEDIRYYIVKNETTGFEYSDDTFNKANDMPHNGFCYSEEGTDAKITFHFVGTELAIWTNFYNTSTIRYSVDGGSFKQISCDRHAPTQLVSDLASEEHTVTIEPVMYGEESGGQMKIGALFIRDAEKQSVKGDTDYYPDYNRLSFKLPAGSYAVKYVPLFATSANLPVPQVGEDHLFLGWKTEGGKLLEEHEILRSGAVLTASVVGKDHTHAPVSYEHTARKHTGICSCGTVLETESHEFGDWVVTKEATSVETGEKQRTCSCGYADVRTLMIDPNNVVTTTATEAVTTTTTISASGEEDPFPVGAVAAVGAAAAIAVAGAIATAVALKKKKAKTEDAQPAVQEPSDEPKA